MKCYTIGHSNHSMEKFVELIRTFDVDLIVDVRSSPFSAYSPQFNRDLIEHRLSEQGISYEYLGDSLGARHSDSCVLFPDGKVNFSIVRTKKEFILGLQKIVNLIRKGFNPAIMCSEKDPYDCHRFVLISHALELKGLDIEHILDDGSLIKNEDLEARMRKEYSQSDLDCFENGVNVDSLEQLYEKRNKAIAFKAIH